MPEMTKQLIDDLASDTPTIHPLFGNSMKMHNYRS